MSIENEKAVAGEKIFQVDEIAYSIPCQVDKKLLHWGVLDVYWNKWFSLNEINDIISELYKKQPHIQGALNVEISIGWKIAETRGYHAILNFHNYFYEAEEVNENPILKYRNNKKLFALNEDGFAEYFVAESNKQAFEYAKDQWGEPTMKEYIDEYLQANEGATLDDFIGDFCNEKPKDMEFTADNVTKLVEEWLKDVERVPSFFAVENY